MVDNLQPIINEYRHWPSPQDCEHSAFSHPHIIYYYSFSPLRSHRPSTPPTPIRLEYDTCPTASESPLSRATWYASDYLFSKLQSYAEGQFQCHDIRGQVCLIAFNIWTTSVISRNWVINTIDIAPFNAGSCCWQTAKMYAPQSATFNERINTDGCTHTR